MPLTIHVPETELYDPVRNRFITVKAQTLVLEHSLLSISKWESKWHKAYLSMEEKTQEEVLDYLRCMTLTPNVDPNVYLAITTANVAQIDKYMKDPMSATVINQQNKRPSREIITSELIYYWMTALNIPFDPCQKWHINRLMMLIEVASIKQQPPKKMRPKDVVSQYASLNAMRRAKHHTKG